MFSFLIFFHTTDNWTACIKLKSLLWLWRNSWEMFKRVSDVFKRRTSSLIRVRNIYTNLLAPIKERRTKIKQPISCIYLWLKNFPFVFLHKTFYDDKQHVTSVITFGNSIFQAQKRKLSSFLISHKFSRVFVSYMTSNK